MYKEEGGTRTKSMVMSLRVPVGTLWSGSNAAKLAVTNLIGPG